MAKHNVWMSVSDLMTGLMVIFLFIAIAYMIRVRDDISEYKDTKEVIYNKLNDQFSDHEIPNGIVSVNPDLSMRFLQATTQFASGQRTLPPEFQQTLLKVIPKYFRTLSMLNDTLKSKLKEIRIEGHTDNIGFPQIHEDPYRANLILSQERARNVLFFILDIIRNEDYSESDKQLFQHLLTANGYSFNRALDSSGHEVYASGNAINKEKSRRVEIRIITDEKAILEKLIEKTGR
ncbi:MAG: flagellar motor protein MotB [Sodaliphilus sp.]